MILNISSNNLNTIDLYLVLRYATSFGYYTSCSTPLACLNRIDRCALQFTMLINTLYFSNITDKSSKTCLTYRKRQVYKCHVTMSHDKHTDKGKAITMTTVHVRTYLLHK